ncbi:hypothetical protein ABC0392 [Shouchella clausii KSM-K16]|uniref:L-2-amino-thiazoline-4-carboxylic acid hydrolase n=1 Tax=Shouchella clausii (strain KSM-K16) TaxID=66692 RepID=Q5WL21_SHOC1|nr:hypothetical protein ABC0392 [Shouchella clausii KSM-K16]
MIMVKNLSMEIITAKMFNELHVAILEAYPDEGYNLIKKGLIAFGLKDAELIAIQATSEGQNHHFFEYLPPVLEVQEKYASLTPFARFAKMFAQIAKQVVDEYGEKGEAVIMSAVEQFGKKRGQGIAQRARSNGFENTVENYLSHYDMGRSELFEFESSYKKEEIEQTFTKCPLGQQWADDGTGEYGILYCRMIDPSIAKGYNKNFDVVHDQYVLKEGQCHFKFQMKEGR